MRIIFLVASVVFLIHGVLSQGNVKAITSKGGSRIRRRRTEKDKRVSSDANKLHFKPTNIHLSRKRTSTAKDVSVLDEDFFKQEIRAMEEGFMSMDTGSPTTAVGSPSYAPSSSLNIRDDIVETPVNIPVIIDVVSNDGDPNIKHFDLSSCRVLFGPYNGNATNNENCVFLYTPASEFVGTDTFTYEICDLSERCGTAVVTVIVTAVNAPPVPEDDTIATLKNTLVDIDAAANDSDPDDNLDISSCAIIFGPSNGDAVNDSNTCVFTYTPELDFIGTDEFVYAICDMDGLCDRATITIVVEESNVSPNAEDDSSETPMDTPVTIEAATNDVDPNDNLDLGSCAITLVPMNGSVTNDGSCVFTYSPDTTFLGVDEFIYNICDTEGLCDTATVSIVVTALNLTPVAQDDSVITTENTPIDIGVAANDSDPEGNLDAGSCSVTSVPASGGVVNIGNCVFTYTPNVNFILIDAFTYEICDTSGLCDTATVTITVEQEVPPNALDDSTETPLNIPVEINAGGNDTDPNDNLDLDSCNVITSPTSGTVNNEGNCLFTYTPDTGFAGVDEFTYSICDTADLCAMATVTIDVLVCGLPVEEWCELLKAEIILSGVTSAEDIKTSPQSDALDWLCNVDARRVCPGDGYCTVEQRYIMATLYFATEGDDWTNCSKENTGTPCIPISDQLQPGYNPNESARFLDEADECDWYGIRCDAGEDQCIRILQLEAIGQSGAIPSEVSKLNELRFLALEDGTIGGSIPDSLNELTNLMFLDLDAQELTGAIPETVFSIVTLRTLDLNDNNLVGTLSPSIGDLTNLSFFQINGNMMTGEIPDTFSSLVNLDQATFESNNFTGTMPASICQIELDVLQGDCAQCDPVKPCCTACQ